MKFHKIILWAISLVFLSMSSTWIEAAGREKPEQQCPGTIAPPILVNSWYRDRIIQVAVANVTEEARAVKVAIGADGIQSDPFSSQSLTVPARSISIVYFPMLRQKTSKGEIKDADFISVFRPDGYLIDMQALQKADHSRSQMTTQGFLAVSGDSLNISYDLEPGSDLRLLFVPRSLQAQDKVSMQGKPGKGSPRTCSEEDLGKLGLSDDYSKQARTRLTDNFGYIVKAGERAEISIDYSVPEIADCAVVRLADYQYLFASGGSVRYGGGPLTTVMIYNPSVMKIAPSSPLVPEGEGGEKQKMK